ncbi:ABC transporter type 1, transmembrane domain-containing protein [Aspergillus egyptiacus]|nr:ABC transporter type 1, transmembrane domain-containing protein [Aspergillus egyptiacus]
MPPPVCNDDAFGPVAYGCPGRSFDFTRTFENIFLSLIPNTLFLVIAILRSLYLDQHARVVNGVSFQLLKLFLSAAYVSLEIVRAILLTANDDGTTPRLTMATIAMAVVGPAAMLPLSFLEHGRSPRPSSILTGFLLLTVICDIVLIRTSWLAGQQAWEVADASIQTTAVALKSIILVAESTNKRNWIAGWCKEDHSPEETVGLFSLALFTWLNPLFLRGYRQHIRVDSLYAIDLRLQAETMFSKLTSALDNIALQARRSSLAKTLAREFAGPILLPVAPRLAMIGFTFCQPFFIKALISNIASSSTASDANNSYGLIGACVLIYGGIALSTSLYSYFTWRALYMIRASLVSAIYQKTLDSEPAALADGAAVTLMSTDIERMMTGWVDIHSVWASVIEIALGCYLLHSQIGLAFLSPIVVIFVCFAGMVGVGATAGKSQSSWMQKIESRVAMTATLLAHMKPCKISGMVPGFARLVQDGRDGEIRVGNQFRWLQVIAASLAYAPVCLSPVIAFAFAGQHLDVVSFFTSLSFLTLVTSPLTTVFQQIPGVIAGFTCLSRIDEFLGGDMRSDPRIQLGSSDTEKTAVASLVSPVLISIVGGHFGWTMEQSVLRDINIVVLQGRLTVVLGPVASGKSTLCKAILGEVPFTKGEVRFTSAIPSVGYCDQTPFLSNLSIRDNIIGFSPFNQLKYKEVIRATALGPDIDLLPDGHDTVVGSSGGMLSGGQKQRVSLARALYQESPLLLLDDTFTGLDQATETEVFHRVFGVDGLVRRQGSTAILFTSSERYLTSADHVIRLGQHGTVLESVHETDIIAKNYISGIDEKEPSPLVSVESNLLSENLSRRNPDKGIHQQTQQVGDLAVYKHYFGTIRIPVLAMFVLSCMLFGFGNSFPTAWISFWASDTYSESNAFYMGLYAVLRILQLLGFFLAALLALGPMVSDAGTKLHSNALSTVIRAPLHFFTNTDIGAITNLFSQDTTIIDSELPEQLFNIAAGLCGLIGTACVIALASPWLALTYPILAAVFWVIQRVYLRTSKQLRFLDLEAKSPLYANFLETTQGITTIRAFGWATKKLDQNHHLLDQSQRPAYLLSMVQLWLLLTANLITTGIATAMTALATQLRADAGFTGASAVTLMTFSSLVTILIRDYTAFETSLGAVSRLKSLSDGVKPEDQEGEDLRPDEQWPSEGRIEIENLSAAYDEFPPGYPSDEVYPNLILKDINLTVSPGEKLAICGRTGSGKSSLILVLLRLLDAIPNPSLKLTIDSTPLQQLDRSTLRSRIIGVPQDPIFLPTGTTIKENLDPWSLATDAECLSVLSTVHLHALAGPGPETLHSPLTADQLSGGQKKLFGLGRAILRRILRDKKSHGARGRGILVLDEITSGVDAATARMMHEIMTKEFSDYTVLAVVHGLEIVPEFFGQVVVIEQGAIVERGAPAELLQKSGSWFKRLFDDG